MVTSKTVTAVSRVVREETAAALTGKLNGNIWATPSRASPNGEKLKDGAIQRASVSTQGDALSYVKANPAGIGTYKREELNVKAGAQAIYWSSPWDRIGINQQRVCRIYMPQRKHVHCHPTNKTPGNYWAIEFHTVGMHKSPLMGWKSGSHDMMSNISISFGRLSDAVNYCQTMGWGYDISYPIQS